MKQKDAGIYDFPEIELKVNGASIIFYGAFVFDHKLDIDDEISILRKLSNFQEFSLTDDSSDSDEYYVNAFFHPNCVRNNDHIVFKRKEAFAADSIIFSNGERRWPIVTQYLTLYNKKILLFQQVIVLEKTKTKRSNCEFDAKTMLEDSICIDDIINIVQSIKDYKTGAFKGPCNEKIKEDIIVILDALGMAYTLDETNKVVDGFFNDESVGIQIWDIASYIPYDNPRKDNLDEECKKCREGNNPSSTKNDKCRQCTVFGESLVALYFMEMHALLSCTTKTLKDGRWKAQGAQYLYTNQTATLDFYNDHKVLFNDKICVEISQEDHPSIKNSSAIRLKHFGYDSSSIFLWGYSVILKAGYTNCDEQLLKIKTANTDNIDKTDYSYIKTAKQVDTIWTALEEYSRFESICTQLRHKKFVKEIVLSKGLDKIYEHSLSFMDRIKSTSDVALGETQLKTGIASKSSSNLLAIVSIILVLLPVNDIIAGINPAWNTVIIVMITKIIVIFLAYCVWKIPAFISKLKKRK